VEPIDPTALTKKQKREIANMEVLTAWTLPDRNFDWQDEAQCVGQGEIFFFENDGASKGRFDASVAVCNGCTVKGKCLQFALNNEMEYGVWGGKTPTERRDMLKKRGWKKQ
jgi:WhiB family redox-sensing transcriptional regulator